MFTWGAIVDGGDGDEDNILLLGLLTGAVVARVSALVDDDDVAAEVDGGIAANTGGFTVFGIPHICDSVVLTTLRLGLLGSHIFAFSSGDTVVVLGELLLLPADGDGDGDEDNGNCCAYTIPAKKIVANINIIVTHTTSINLVHLCIIDATLVALITYKDKINYYRRKIKT